MGKRYSAELLADRGEAAAGEEFFRSPPFLEAEGVTHTLRVSGEGAELLAPLIVRDIPGAEAIDGISPYGYPGLGGSPGAAPLDPDDVDWTPTGLVSLFLRHALDEPPLAAAAARSIVQIADPALPRKSRSSDRNRINRNRRAGYAVRIVPGAAASAAERAGFLAAYEETMRRTAAAERYLFGAAYFDRILASRRAWLALALAPDGEAVAAGSIAVQSDGFLHYFLSGSADAQLRDSPMKNLVAALIDLAAERGLPLNFGGGIARGDRLEEFKRGFANREQPWHVSEIVCDPAAYARLCAVAGTAGADFFPAYRSS